MAEFIKMIVSTHIKMKSFNVVGQVWVAKLEETITVLGIKVRTNRIIASDYVLASSCVMPTISDTTGYVSDYPVNKADVLSAVQNQYKCFIGEK